MKKIRRTIILLGIILTCILSSCGKGKQTTEDDLTATITGTESKDGYVKILKSGTVENGAWTTEDAEIEFVSWESGYGRNTMSFDIPCIVLKFHVKNTSDSDYRCNHFVSIQAVVDGELASIHESNVLAEDFKVGALSSTELPAGVGTDYYLNIELDPEKSHVIEIKNSDGKEFTINYDY
ncbi:hypothetical protein [Butyrivibrio fibrisolvens]|uniref:hypothetical protein n=1 Tax=Butyrivibrio fibrisolvens TaxID=831 RepID=UPI0003B5CA16|nr:hypothetical protein [Butyrivibrio fibrisolvens]